MQVSLIINTYNRASHLRRLLPSLMRLRGVVFEVIVVNGPSSDDTDGVLSDYADRIKVLSCPVANLSVSRNIGINAASGDYVAFIDDDALPADEDWLLRFVKFFNTPDHERFAAVGGSVLHRDTDHYEFDGGATTDYGIQRFALSDAGTALRWAVGIPGGNCAYRRKALLEVGGYDEYYVYYLDETDVCWRLIRAGYHIGYVRDAAIRHYAVRSGFDARQQGARWRRVTQSDTYFALKNGQDSLPTRVWRTLSLARRKHYFKEIWRGRDTSHLTYGHWLAWLFNWFLGFSIGIKDGLWKSRRLNVAKSEPGAFKVYSSALVTGPLRIALFSQALPGQKEYGGIGRYIYDLALGLFERGHEVHVFCRDEQPLHWEGLGFLIHGISWNQTMPYRLFGANGVLNRNIGHSLALYAKLRDLYRDGVEFDVVHVPNWDVEGLALIQSRMYPTVSMVVTPLAQTIRSEGWELTPELRTSVALERWHAEHADVVCAPSQGVLGTYEKLLGIPHSVTSRWRIVQLGIVPKRVTVLRARSTGARRRLLFVGRCEARKGAHTLLAVLPMLLSDFPDWECHFVGNDAIVMANGRTLKQDFLDRHRNAAWLDRVTFHGTVSESELQQHYVGCDVFVAPSLYESFGLIYLEAMQYGKPVVGCNVGGVPEVVSDGVDGLLVEPDTALALEAALRKLFIDEPLRVSLGEAGLYKAHRELNYKTMAQGMESIYRDAVSKVGMSYSQRRKAHWARSVSASPAETSIKWSSEWKPALSSSGADYQLGAPGARVEMRLPVGKQLAFQCHHHAWSGALRILCENQPLKIVDLFSKHPNDVVHRLQLRPGHGDETVTVVLEVMEEKNPQSNGHEVWLRGLEYL